MLIFDMIDIDLYKANRTTIKNMQLAMFGDGKPKTKKKEAANLMADTIKRNSPSAQKF